MENFITHESSHSKRFTNSISAYEAFIKNYSKNPRDKLPQAINQYKYIFILISDMGKDTLPEFLQKVIRSRNYHTHSNLGNKDVFTEYELLYISLLFDFVIGYLLLEKIGVSEALLEKFKQRGKSVFVDIQSLNSILSSNPLLGKN